MTTLSKPVTRLTAKRVAGKDVVVTIAPLRGQDEAIIGLRLLGERRTYTLLLSDAYRYAALQYGQKEAAARRTARKNGIPWRQARKVFLASVSIPKFTEVA